MSTDTDGNGSPEMVKLDVKVTKQRKEEIDRMWREEGYPNRSEFIRDVLRDATNPMLTADALRQLAEGVEDVEQGRTVSLDEAKERLGLDE
ncbi:ribbon-helix-helix domain-containing protein [Halorussus ruber]|uniref:ribbon-helix-helix domain-containing protein n=1 Tax=Halorussus ruber TaxID=1126238 RepID=UPI00109196CE|nr:ribbon-helix-helix protein, CopG family [Halorussus ruber]